MAKSDLAKMFYRLTGLTWDLDKLIEDTPEKKKGELYNKLSWIIKRGQVVMSGEQGELFAQVLPQLASKLGIDASADDADKDGDVDTTDEKIKKDLEIASSIKVETSDSEEEDDEDGGREIGD